MGTDFDYSNYYYKNKGVKYKPEKKHRPKKTRTRYSKGRKRAIAVCAAVIALSIIIYFLLNSFGGDSGTALTVNGSEYFAVNMGTYADESSAKIQAEKVRARGAAGYIVSDNNYKILASCYTTKRDAESVIDSLKKGLVSASLFVVSVPKVHIQNISEGAKDTLTEALSYYQKIYADLYAITVGIDTGALNAEGIYGALEALISGVSGVSGRLDNLSDSDSGARLAHIKALYVSVLNLLSAVNLYENYFDISVNLRYNYLRILYMFIELYKEINT